MGFFSFLYTSIYEFYFMLGFFFNFNRNKSLSDFGIVLSLKDGIAEVSGLKTVTSGELVKDIYGNYGLVLNLQRGVIGVVFLTDNFIKTGDFIYRCYKL